MKRSIVVLAHSGVFFASACVSPPLAGRWVAEGIDNGSDLDAVFHLHLEPVSQADGTLLYEAELRFDTPDGPRGARGSMTEESSLVTAWLNREHSLGGLSYCIDQGEWPKAEGDLGYTGGVSDDRQTLTLRDNALGPCFVWSTLDFEPED